MRLMESLSATVMASTLELPPTSWSSATVTFVDFFDEGGMKCLRLSFESRVARTCFVDCFDEGGTIFRPRWSNITDLKLEC